MSSAKLCQICKSADFKYSCPKCNIPFCSVACYKNPVHLQCSEEFYKNCIREEMSLRRAPESIADIPGLSDDIIRMYEILKRFENDRESTPLSDVDIDDFDFETGNHKNREELDSDDEDTSVDLAKRLKGVNWDDPDEIWARLTSNEKQDFESIVQKGEISRILPPFQPWWSIQKKTKLIEDICDDSDERKTGEVIFRHPQIKENIQSFEKLLSKEPSPCLTNNLINIYAAYTCTVRFFNGEHHTCPLEATKYLVILSATLKSNANFDDEEQALKSVIYEGQTHCLEFSPEDYHIIREDVNQILEGRYKGKSESTYKLAALSDMHKLFTAAKASQKSSNSTANTSKFSKKFMDVKITNLQELSRSKINQLIKKIEFFLSFVHSKM